MPKYSFSCTVALIQASGQILLIEENKLYTAFHQKKITHFTKPFTDTAAKMTKFIAAFEDFFKSIYELFASIIGTFASFINTLVTTVLNFFSGVINLFVDVGKGAVDLVGGIGKFIAGKSNAIIISQQSVRILTLCHRQRCGPWSDRGGCLHLHPPAAGKACGPCKKDQLELST